MNAPSNALELLRTRSYLVLLGLAAVIGVPDLRGCVRLPGPRRPAAAVGLHGPPQGAGPGVGAALVAAAPPRGRGCPSRADDPVPSRERRPLAGGRLQGRRRADSDRTARRRAGRARHTQPGRGARPRGAADRPSAVASPCSSLASPDAMCPHGRRLSSHRRGASPASARCSNHRFSPPSSSWRSRGSGARRWMSCSWLTCSPLASAHSCSSGWAHGPGWERSRW